MPNQKNQDIVNDLKNKIQEAKSITFVDYKGLNVNDINNFRQQMTDEGSESVIAKNTLVKLALEEKGIDTKDMEQHLKGPTAAIFSYKDPVAYLKPLFEFAKKFELPKIKFALVEGIFTNAEKVEQISQLPSKQQLLAQVVGGLKSPLSGFVNVIGGNRGKLVTVLSKIADEKIKGGAN